MNTYLSSVDTESINRDCKTMLHSSANKSRSKREAHIKKVKKQIQEIITKSSFEELLEEVQQWS